MRWRAAVDGLGLGTGDQGLRLEPRAWRQRLTIPGPDKRFGHLQSEGMQAPGLRHVGGDGNRETEVKGDVRSETVPPEGLPR